jgi:hypothetical protein
MYQELMVKAVLLVKARANVGIEREITSYSRTREYWS